jgi:M6 family metalloprotease-like protein
MSRVSKSMGRGMWCAGVLFCVFMAAALIVPQETRSAPLQDISVTVKQPDGEVLHLFASGDEFHNWLHDADHFTVIQDPVTGYYVYAVEDADGNVAPSIYQVGKVKPAAVGLKQGANLSPPKIREKVLNREDLAPNGSPLHPQLINKAPQTGTINNLVIFIRFSDSPDFTHKLDAYKELFNSKESGFNSMYNYYREASYQKLTIDTTFYPTPSGAVVLSYQDSRPRGYYLAYNAVTNPDGYGNKATRTTREHTLLMNAVNAVSSQVPPGLNIDGDNDGRVDNVCFIVQGEPAGWNNLLWPHMWSLYSYEVSINNKLVWTYNFQLETSMDSSGVGVLAHEMFHSLGAPDLYHYTYNKNVSPAWKWDLMNNDLNPPEHMTAYMKMQYGKWIGSIETITKSGNYKLKPITSSENNAYKIASPNSSTEYFVLEYRKKAGTFENSLPNEGLLVYRVNSTRSGKGNGSSNYGEQIYDELYVYRPGGTAEDDGTPADATFSSGSQRTQINDATDPSSFLSDGSAGGLKISNVGAVGDTISFDVELTSAAQPDLKPYKPTDWPDEMVLSKKAGTHHNNSTFLTSDTLYVDCAIVNDTSVAVNQPFWMSLYVDGDPVWNWRVSSLSGNTHEQWQDLYLGGLSIGEHQIKMIADTLGTVEETSENDNTYTRTITVKEAGLPNLAPFKPSGWSDKIVVSNVRGTHTDVSLHGDDKLYVDWSVINKGPGDVTEKFTVMLYVDGFKKKTWTRSEGLEAGQSLSVSDFALKSLEEGLHQIKIQVDRENAVVEGNDSDNQYTRFIEVLK